MNKSIILSSILISMILLGCKPVIKILYGIKKPKYETTESIEAYKRRVFKTDAPTLVLKPDEWLNNKVLRCPDIFVFDKNGNYIPYKDSLKPNCNGPAELFLEQLDTLRTYHFSQEYALESFINKLENPGCVEPTFSKNKSVDFYVFTTWMNWTGKKIYKEKTLEWLKSLEKNNTIRYELFFVNQDFQECWDDDLKARLENRSK